MTEQRLTKTKRPRGRPKSESKRTGLLDAARILLLTVGPGVTTDDIASRAGVSKSTLYANFSGKMNLIEAVVRREADLTITDEEYARLTQESLTPQSLVNFGIRYVNFINQRDLIGWDRLIALMEAEHPEFHQQIFDLGPGRAQQFLTQLLKQGMQQGFLTQVDADVAADVLTGLWLGFVNLAVKLGVRDPLSAHEIEERVQRGVSIFLRFYGAQSSVIPV